MNGDTVGVLIEWVGRENFMSQGREFERLVQNLRKRKPQINLKDSYKGLQRQKQELVAFIKQLEVARVKAKSLVREFQPNSGLPKWFNAKSRAAYDPRKNLDKTLQDARMYKKLIEAQMVYTPKIEFGKLRREWSSKLGGFAVGLETLGNGISQLANNPINEIFTGMFRQIGVGLSTLMYQGFSTSVSRFDTFRTFPKIMSQMFGKKSTGEASQAIEFLNKNVLGLPTGLDEITQSAQKYISAMQSIKKGSRLAVASNNAFLASFSDENQKYLGQRQLNRLAAGIDLTAVQWQSLINSMPNAINEVGKTMGYKSVSAFQKALMANQIDGKDFINALIKTGNEGGALYDMAQEMTDTMTASLENIKNAFSRLGAGLFEVVDAALLQTTGKGLPATIKDITIGIDNFAQKAKDWIKANPDKIRKWVETIKSIDFEAFLKGFGEGLLSGINAIVRVAKIFTSNERTIGRVLGGSGIWGRMVTFAGQVLKGTKGIWAIFPALVQAKMIGNAARGTSLFSGILPRFFKGVGKTTKAAAEVPVASVGKFVGVSSKLKSLFVSLGAITAVAGTATAVMGSILAMAKMAEAIGKVDVNWKSALPKLAGFGTFIAILGSIASKIAGKITLVAFKDIMIAIGVIGAIATSISGLVTLNTWLFKKSAENVQAMTEAIKTTISNVRTIQSSASGVSLNSSTIERVRDIIAQLNKMVIKPKGGGRYSWFDKRGSKNVQELTSNFTETVKTVVELIKSLNAIGDIKEGVKEKLVGMGKFVSDFYNSISNWNKGKGGVDASSNFAELMSNFKSAITSIGDVVTLFGDMKKNLFALTTEQKGGGTNLGKITDSITEMINVMEAITRTIHDKYTFNYSENVAESLGGMVNAITSLKEVAQLMIDMRKNLSTLFGGEGETKGSVISKQMESLITEMSSIMSTFEANFNGQEFGVARLKNIASQTKSLQTAINAIAGVAQTFINAQKNLAKLGEASGVASTGIGGMAGNVAGASMTNGALVRTQLGGMIGQIKTLASQLTDIPDIGSAQSNIKTLNSALSGVGSLVDKLVSLKKKFDENDPSSVISKIKSAISQLAGAFGGNAGGLGGKAQAGGGMNLSLIGGQFQILASAVESFANAMLSLSGKALSSVGKGLSTIGKKLDALDAKFSGKGRKWHDAIMDGLNLPGAVQTALNSAFATYDYSTNGYLTGRSYAMGLQNGLHSVSVTPPTVLGSAAAIVKAKKKASGGLVYASNGKYIQFAPKGTDRVPAMLTEGEFVQRKSAVDHFGAKFMERINNLDLIGALNSLSLRAGRMAMPVGSPTIINNTNNTRNNNASVTQHIHTAKERIAYKHADRYVRAL